MIQHSRQQSLWIHPPGTVVRVSYGLYDHVALLGEYGVGGGERNVLAFSAESRGFVEQPFSDFATGRPVTVDGYLGRLAPEVVLGRARSVRGQTYSLIGFNCEHFVRYAHNVEITSPQLWQWALLGSVGGILALVARA
ncbi:lecithin retinol acyltransferase family protein [Burkholderia contaminans]|uniref:LRAT domain-containing protein n=1 Tax=Burkholderia contaminans TaxID=488447 RepID=A0A3N8P9I1_9BURK|nr:lecithin retinol acyltransferase family protein [Burkholderia contaminans]ELK6464725.1 lecithin retinol acyltransferase family protein [Burkholderia contaminans]RQT08437.1 hypothetical protein DF051_30910 [Burkholderia contaminans]